MKSKKIALLGLIGLVSLLLPGCWKSVGVVDMSKVMTPDEIWEKRDQLVGKVVTVEFDTVDANSSCCGTPLEINGRHDFKATYFSTLPNYWRQKSLGQWQDSINRTRDTLVSYDTVWNGTYIFHYIVDANLPGFNHPSWVKKEYKYVSLDDQNLFNNTIVYGPKKIFCGVLIGTRLNNFFTRVFCESERAFLFLPIGYKYSSGHLDKFDRSYETH